MALAVTTFAGAVTAAPHAASAAVATRLAGSFVTKTALTATYGSAWYYDAASGHVLGDTLTDNSPGAWDLNTGAAWDALSSMTSDTIEVPAPGHPGPIKFLTGAGAGKCLVTGDPYPPAPVYKYATLGPCETAPDYEYVDKGEEGFWLVTTTGNLSFTDQSAGAIGSPLTIAPSAGYNELFNARLVGPKKVTAEVVSKNDEARSGVIGGTCEPGADLVVRDDSGRTVSSGLTCATDGTWRQDVTGLRVGDNPFTVTQLVDGTETGNASVTVSIGAATVSMVKSSDKAGQQVQAGTAFTYSFQVKNSGSIAATGYVVRDQLPAGLKPANETFPQGDWASYDPATRTVVSNPIASVSPSGGTQTVSLRVVVVAGATNASLVNAALVERPPASTDPATCYASSLPAACVRDLDPPRITPASAVDDTAKTHSGEAVTIPVLANDTGDAASLTVDSVTAPGNGGTAVISADGKTITYTSAAGFTGTETFTYRAKDGGGTSQPATVTVTVIPAPQAKNDAYTIASDSPAASYPVLSNDTGDAIALDPAYSLTAAHGTVSVSGSQLRYQPAAGFSGTDQVTYQIIDSLGATARATVTFTVQSGPTAPDKAVTIPMGGTATVKATIPASGSISTVPASGSATAAGGIVTAAADGTLTYQAKAGFSGADSFTYTVRDTLGQQATGTVRVTVQPAPVARPDAKTIPVAGTATFTVVDAASAPAGVAKITAVTTNPASGTKTAKGGTVTVNADKTISYQAAPGFSGTDTADFTLSDDLGQTSTAKLTITVVDGPVAPAKTATIKKDSSASFTVVPAGGTAASVTTTPPSGSKTAAGGTVTVNADKTLTYQPASGYVGTDTFTYTLTDGLGQAATGTITVTVQAPPAAQPHAATIPEAGTARFTVVDAVSAPAGVAKIASVTSAPATGGTTANGGRVTVNADNTISYVAAAGFSGTDTVSYTLSDDLGQTSTAKLTITVQPAPKAAAQSKTIPEGGTASFTVVDATSAPAGTAKITAVTTSPASGSKTTAGGLVTVNADKTISYVAAAGFSGTDSVSFTLRDDLGQVSTAMLTIVVVPGPEAGDQAKTIKKGGTATFTVLDKDAPAATTVTTTPASGTKTAKGGTVTVGADRTISYVPDPAFTGVDTVAYVVKDALGQQATGTLTITVQAPPAPQDQAATIAVGGRTTFTVVTAASAPAGMGKITSVTTVPATGGATSNGGIVTVNADKTITYAAPAGYSGTDSVTYTLTDDLGQAATATLRVTIQPAPAAKAATKTIPMGGTASFTVIDAASAPAGAGKIASLDTRPASGGVTSHGGTVTVAADRTISYKAPAGFSGTDTVDFTLTDDLGQSSGATLTIYVQPAPVAADKAALIAVGGTATFAVIDGTSAPAGTGKIASVTTSPASGSATAKGGTVTAAKDGTLTYQGAAGYSGTDTFTYTLTDDLGQTSTASVTITIQPGVVAPDKAATIAKDATATFTVVDAASAPAGGAKVTVTTTPASGSATANGGTVTVGADKTVTYKPKTGFTGTDTFTYTLTDDLGQKATGTITVVVQPPPAAQGAQMTIPAGGRATFAVIDDVSAPAGTGTIASVTTAPASGGKTVNGGTITVDPGKTVSYQAAVGFTGRDSFTYTLRDDLGQASTATLIVLVQPGPSAADFTRTIKTGGEALFTVITEDSAPAGADKIAAVTTNPPAGRVTAGGGSVTVDGARQVRYQAAPNFTGTDTFTYTLTDDQGQASTGTVTITVRPVPLAPDLTKTIPMGGTATFDVVTADTAPAGVATIKSVTTSPAAGSTTPGGAAVGLTTQQQVTYAAAAGFHGTEKVTYTVTDDLGQEATGTITVVVQPAPRPADKAVTIAQGAEVSFTVVDAASAPAGAAHITGVKLDPAGGKTGLGGQATVNADKTITYRAAPGVHGEDSFRYGLTDDLGQQQWATITVTIQQAPAAQDATAVIPMGGKVSFTVIDAESAPAGAGKIASLVTIPAAGSTTAAGGKVTVGADRVISYEAAPGYSGTDSLTFTLKDDLGQSSTAKLTVVVQPAPSAPAKQALIPMGGTASFTVLDAISAPAGIAKIASVTTSPASGQATANGGTVTVAADNTVAYQAAPGFSGTDTFTYTVTDDLGQEATGTITVVVQPAPRPADKAVTIAQGAEVSFTVVDAASAPAGAAHITGVKLDPAGGKTGLGGQATVNADKTITYAARPGAHGEDSFRYGLTDDLGQQQWATITVTIQQAPAAKDATAVIPMGGKVSFTVVTPDSMPAGVSKLAKLTLSGVEDLTGTVTQDAGSVTYQAADGFAGSEEWAYTLTDDLGQSATAKLTVTVQKAPQITGQSKKIALNSAASFDLAGTYSGTNGKLSIAQPAHGSASLTGSSVRYEPEKDYAGQDTVAVTVTDDLGQVASAELAITVQAPPVLKGRDDLVTGISQPLTTSYLTGAVLPFAEGTTFAVGSVKGGTAKDNGDGTITFTPDAGSPAASGSYDVTATDDVGQTSTARFEIEIVAGPAANDATVVTTAGRAAETEITGTIANGEKIALAISAEPAHGSATVTNGTIRYEPAEGFSGIDQVGYTVTDKTGQQASAVVTVLVFAPPVAPDLEGSTKQETPISFDPLTAAAEKVSADEANATASATAAPTQTASAARAAGDATVMSAAYHPGAQRAAAMASTVAVKAADVVPGTRTDAAGRLYAPTTLTKVTGPGHGSATIQGATITYTPAAQFSGTDTFGYTVSDALGQVASGTITVMVEAVPTPTPVATPSPTPVLTCAPPATCSPAPLPQAGTTAVATPTPVARQATLPFTGVAIGGVSATAILALAAGWLLFALARRRRRQDS